LRIQYDINTDQKGLLELKNVKRKLLTYFDGSTNALFYGNVLLYFLIIEIGLLLNKRRLSLNISAFKHYMNIGSDKGSGIKFPLDNKTEIDARDLCSSFCTPRK